MNTHNKNLSTPRRQSRRLEIPGMNVQMLQTSKKLRRTIVLSVAFTAGLGILSGAESVRAEIEPLDLIVHAPSELGSWRFLQGAPFELTVSLVNAEARRAEEAAKQDWIRQVREASQMGAPLPDHPGIYEVAPELQITVGADNMVWFADLIVSAERLGPIGSGANTGSSSTTDGEPVLTNLLWSDLRTTPTERVDGEVVLELDPVWTTMTIPPSVTENLAPGRYRFTATKSGATTGTLDVVIQNAQTREELGQLHLEQARYALRSGNPEDAVVLAQLALTEVDLDRDVIRLTLGQAYAATGQLEPALENLEAFLAAYENEERWEEFPLAIRNYVEDLKLQIEEGR